MAQKKTYDVVIIGGGPAGLAAGIYVKRAALEAVLVEKGVPGGQVCITKGVENYPGIMDISGFDLSDKFFQHAKSYELETIQDEVTAIEPGAELHSVRLAGGEVIEAHSIILAAGGTARKLNVPGEIENFGRGVSYCATCDGFFFRQKVVCVIGGGDTALEDALYLAKIAKHVYLIHRRDEFRGSKILQQRIFAEPAVEIILNTVPTSILADESGVRAVALKNTRTGDQRELPVDGAFIFVGFSPNSGLVPAGVAMNDAGYVLTDDKLETSIPGIFCAGDLRQNFAKQIVIATSEGCIAALAAARYVETKKAHGKLAALVSK
ncbi:MAG: thioredoxin-disulfide reductase [Syntrophobacteraceae bacterium]|nr:thioredoxin-disulfide reductase [Syntrophobacteraceae bacterium]